MAYLPKESFTASTAFTKFLGLTTLALSQYKLDKKAKVMILSVYMSNYESGLNRSGTQVGHR